MQNASSRCWESRCAHRAPPAACPWRDAQARLVYCDDDRINLMFDALSRAGKHQQVIVLTCRLRTFAPLGGHTLRVQMDGDCE
jgi:hypothetical protein